MKIERIKHIANLPHGPAASEGIDAGYQDIFVYALFALMKEQERKAK